MEDPTIHIDNKAGAKPDSPLRFGMSSFDINEREKLGQSLRLAMACIEAPSTPANTSSMPFDESGICERLKAITQEVNSSKSESLSAGLRYLLLAKNRAHRRYQHQIGHTDSLPFQSK